MQIRIRDCFAFLVLVIAVQFAGAAADSAFAENWPGWRGPRQDGTSTHAELPTRWSNTENIAWKAALKYSGHSSPIVWGDRVFLGGFDEAKQTRMLICLNRKTGKTVWERAVLAAPPETKHALNSFASGTPATDGELVFISFLEVDGSTIPAPNVGNQRPVTPGQVAVAAYDFDGNRKWLSRPGDFISAHGFASNPALYKDKVIVNGDHDGESWIAALDRKTGRTLWKTDREHGIRSYCTPIIRKFGGRMQLILSGSKHVAAYNPDDGKRLWHLDGPTEQFVASPAVNHGLVFITGGFPDRHVLAIDPTGTGDITGSKYVQWHHERSGASYVPSPVAAGDWFFIVSDNGIGTCFDSKTGATRWQERLGSRFSASLVAGGGHVYFLNDDGITKVVKASDEFELVAENKLGEPVSASPAISGGQIFIRGDKHLFCIGAERSETAAR